MRMSARRELRDLLMSRRANLTPADVGIREFGKNRRVPGLRREEVALLAGISVDHYARLERGVLPGPSASVIAAVAHALRMSDLERIQLSALQIRVAASTQIK